MISYRTKIFFFLFFTLSSFVVTRSQTFSDINYTENTENFTNPDRGFYHYVDNIDYNQLLNFRQEGISLIFRNYRLDAYKEGDIDNSFLNNLRNDFDVIRNAGMKIVIRFSYTDRTSSPYGDAPLNIVIRHVQQLKPILRENEDVILTVQAGFIGSWGEWYYTDYFSESPGNVTEENWNDRRTFVDTLLNSLPDDMMIQVRTPNQKYHLLQMDNYTPVTTEQAYSALPIARIGHHNDCFVAGNYDFGTYQDTTIEKPYLEEDSKYTIVGGETCNQCAESECANAVKELSRFHWSFINIDYDLDVINDWINDGCFETIQKKLGYRFKLISMTAQDQAAQGSKFDFSIKLINIGWANPSKKYIMKFILRDINTDEEYSYYPEMDIRFCPLKDTISLDFNTGISQDIPEGQYKLFLALVNSNQTLSNRPEYSIRFANENCWESNTGYNNLNHTLTIDNTNNIETYNGTEAFGPMGTIEQEPIIASTSYGNNNLIYWLRPDTASTSTLLQRSEDGVNFIDITSNTAEKINYIDKNLDKNKSYYYRAKYFDNMKISGFSETIIQAITENPRFAHISTDGNIDDWNPVPYTANGIINDSIASIQFYNDKDSIFALIKAKNIDTVKIYLNINDDRAFDYLISQDSLFKNNNGNYNFVKTINLVKTNKYFEIGILMNDIEAKELDAFDASVFINKQELWWTNQNFTYAKYAMPDTIENFKVEYSINNPYTNLKISWKLNTSPDGYTIERSVGDNQNFLELVDLAANKSYYIDENLDSSLTYYYRMYSYKGISTSAYSNIEALKPGANPTGISSLKLENFNLMRIAPNPVVSSSILYFNIQKPIQATLSLYNIKGELIKNIYSGTIYPNTKINIDKNNLPKGIYTLVLSSNQKNAIKKIIIK